MGSKRKKPRENDLAERYRAGDFEKHELYEEDEDQSQRFSNRNKNAEQDKIEKTAVLRAAEIGAQAEHQHQTDLDDEQSDERGRTTRPRAPRGGHL